MYGWMVFDFSIFIQSQSERRRIFITTQAEPLSLSETHWNPKPDVYDVDDGDENDGDEEDDDDDDEEEEDVDPRRIEGVGKREEEAKESECKTAVEAEAKADVADMDSLSGVSSNGSVVVARSENSITSGSSNASQSSDTVMHFSHFTNANTNSTG